MSISTTPTLAQIGLRRGSARRQRGLTLIEFMISITIGMIIVVALTLLIARQSATQGEFEKSSRQIENGRFAMRILNDDIQMAGFFGELSDVGAPVSFPNPCATALTDLEAALPFPVQGYDLPSTGSWPFTCINTDNYLPGTDILVVRRAEAEATTIAAAASAAGGFVYLQTGLTDPVRELKRFIGTGADTSVFTLKNNALSALTPLRRYRVNIYFVSPCSVPVSGSPCSNAADGGKPIPTLKMVELTTLVGAPAMTTTPLVEGIENMQIDYGFDTTADGSPDGQFKSTAAAVADWSNVVALRVHLLARNLDSSPDYIDSKIYTLGYNAASAPQTVTASTDSYGNNVRTYKRRVFSQSIRLVNPSGRRDQ